MDLLFCIDSKNFVQKITEKSYPKYKSQSHRVDRKPSLKVVSTTNDTTNTSFDSFETSESLFENHIQIKTQKRGYYVDYTKDSSKRSYSKKDLT